MVIWSFAMLLMETFQDDSRLNELILLFVYSRCLPSCCVDMFAVLTRMLHTYVLMHSHPREPCRAMLKMEGRGRLALLGPMFGKFLPPRV